MKEKTKSAARTRREKENNEYTALAKLLPLPWAITAQLDKASVVRLSASYLQLRCIFQEVFPSFHASPLTAQTHCQLQLKELGSHLMQGLEGFIMVLSPDGKVMYVSETASVHLGLSQVELTGNSLYDYLYEKDMDDVKRLLQPYIDFNIIENIQNVSHTEGVDSGYGYVDIERSFTVRLRCVLAKRNAGLTCQFGANAYKTVQFFGFLKIKFWNSAEAVPGFHRAGLVAIGTTLPAGSALELRMPSESFLFRTTLDFKIIFLDVKVADITGFSHFELLDKSMYNFVHVCDIEALKTAHEMLLSKRQATSAYYRFVTKEGGWIWMQSQFSIVENQRSPHSLCVVCVNTLLSKIEGESCLLSELQNPFSTASSPAYTTGTYDDGVGVYSEQYYGPNAVLLLQSNPAIVDFDQHVFGQTSEKMDEQKVPDKRYEEMNEKDCINTLF